MTTTARHLGPRSGIRRRLNGRTLQRHGVAAVSGLVAAALLGNASQPVQDVVVHPAQDAAPVDAVRAATLASAPATFFRSASASVTEAAARAALGPSGVIAADIPGPALAAYQRAAAVMDEVAPACELSWTLLAGIGRVESDHGRYGAATLGDDGVSRPHIIGVALDGTGQVAEISDSDSGRLDGDPVWDRAVGPMQFLPTTWQVAGVDGDGDGVRNPHDLDDAALAAAVYLCAGGEDLSQPQGVRSALFRYNHSTAYVALVMAYERSYRLGRFAVDSGPAVPSAAVVAGPDRVAAAPGARETARDAVPPARDPRPAAPAAPAEPAVPRTAQDPASAPEPAPGPSPAPEPTQDPAAAQDPDQTPAPAEDPTPDPAPDPPQEPDLVTVTGLWTVCEDGYCLDGYRLVVGEPEQLDAQSTEDYDGDAVVETLAEELAGLVDRTVVVVVEEREDGWVVYAIADLPYPVFSSTAETTPVA